MLTGQPAFVGRTSAEVLSKTSRGDLADAMRRLDGCDADSELVALAGLPGRRPGGPAARRRAIAARGGAFLAGVQEKLHRAERERAVAEARTVEERSADGSSLAWPGACSR